MKYFRRKSEVSLAARGRMLELIATLARSGQTQLPNLRELCSSLEVSIMTANKIIRRLVAEGRIRTIPRKGYFLTDRTQWDTHIAVIMGMGNDMTYVPSAAVLSGLLESISRLGFHTRIVQVSSPEKAAQVLQEEGVAACAWYFPSAADLSAIEKISKSLGMPSIAVASDSWGCEQNEIKMAHVSLDHEVVGRRRAEFFLNRGHKAIAALNDNRESVGFNAFETRLGEAGCGLKGEWLVKPGNLESHLPALLDSQEVTAAYVLGGPALQKRTFKILKAHPHGHKLTLLSDAYPSEKLQDLLKGYAELKIAGVNLLPDREIGMAAAGTLLDCLSTGKPAKSKELSGRIIDVKDFFALGGWR